MFGIPNSDTAGENGEYLSRIQFDARVGFWSIVKRVQNSDGSWSGEKSEPFRSAVFCVDFLSLEAGYIKLSSPPAFLVVPYGTPIPSQPEEMQTDTNGKARRAFQPGFRVKVCSKKTFGDGEAYYFANSSKTVMSPMDQLHQKYLASPEAAQGKLPIVTSAKCNSIVTKGPMGTNTFFAPDFQISGWTDRPAVFGAQTVAIPGGKAPTTAAPVAAKPKPAAHVPPPQPKAPEPAMADVGEDEIPF